MKLIVHRLVQAWYWHSCELPPIRPTSTICSVPSLLTGQEVAVARGMASQCFPAYAPLSMLLLLLLLGACATPVVGSGVDVRGADREGCSGCNDYCTAGCPATCTGSPNLHPVWTGEVHRPRHRAVRWYIWVSIAVRSRRRDATSPPWVLEAHGHPARVHVSAVHRHSSCARAVYLSVHLALPVATNPVPSLLWWRQSTTGSDTPLGALSWIPRSPCSR